MQSCLVRVIGRRSLALSAAATLAATASGAIAQEAAAPALPFTLKQIGPGVYAAIDGPKGEAGSNAGFVIGDDGVLVIDSFYRADAARALVAEIHKLTPKPIRYVVNTHYHVDHVGGDAVLREAGAIIIAHRNERGWVRTENLHLFGDRVTPAIREQVAALALPDETIAAPTTIWLGARKVGIRPVLGHTGGDLIVEVPDAKAVFAGDILWNRVSPNIIDGNVADWIKTADALAADPGLATFVPGHGDVATAQDVQAFAGYLRDLRADVAGARKRGATGDTLVTAVKPVLKAKYGSWDAFDYFAAKEIGFMADELADKKRRPVPMAE